MNLIEKFIKYSCEEADNGVSTDGITPIAPSGGGINTLWTDFKVCMHEIEVPLHKLPSKQSFKTALIEWQKNSKYGADFGKLKSDNKINGTLKHPIFNLVCHHAHNAYDYLEPEPKNPNLPNYDISTEERLIAQIKQLEEENLKLKQKNAKFQKMIKVLLED